jgi:hypothetical protein
VQLPDPEISGLPLACVMAAGRGSRAAADTVLQHSGAAGAFAAAGASVVVVVVVVVVAGSEAAAVAVVGAARISC